MKTSFCRAMWRAVAVVCLVAVVGCAEKRKDPFDGERWVVNRETEAKPAPAPAPAPAPKAAAPAPAPAPAPTGDGMVRSSMAIPTASRGAALSLNDHLLVEKVAPREVAIGQSFDYWVKATNKSGVELRDVVIADELPAGFQLASSDPASSGANAGRTLWNLGTLAPGQTKSIKVTGKANAAGDLVNCATASFNAFICVATKVVQPALQLTKTAPAEALLCDTIPVKIVVTNSGTGDARNVVVTDNLPDGVTTTDGKSVVKVDAGTIPAGQSREVTFAVKASKAGKFTNAATATADGNLKADGSSVTNVLMPQLAITKKGPGKSYLMRDINYTISVSNTGTGDARDTVVEDVLPTNATFVSASSGGQVAGGKVVWQLGTLKPGDSRELSVIVKGDRAGNVVNKVTTKAACASPAEASVTTNVEGIPAILLEVIDLNDPVEVGQNETYVITATNQGSSPGTNVTITCTLEDAQEYVSSEGPTKFTVQGKVIKFGPLPSLGVGEKATWRVVVKAVKDGDIRFTTEMNEDQLGRPVTETEATNQYK